MNIDEYKQKSLEAWQEQPDFAYFGDLESPPWGVVGGIGQHRDSDALERSNFEVISEDLLERFPESVQIERSSHWAVGWVESMRLDTSDEKATLAAMDWHERLESYPVADEEHWSNLEREEDEEYYQNGGREDAIDILEKSEDFGEIFRIDGPGELIPEYEPYLHEAYHEAMQYGDHTAIPDRELLEAMEEALMRKKDDDRREYEKVQPAIEGM